MEVYDDDGNVICDKPYVLDKWKREFQTLFKEESEIEPKAEEKIMKRMLNDSIYLHEFRMSDPLFDETTELNRNIDLQEVKNAVMKTKKRKAVGIDMLPNEVLKNDNVISILQKLFQLCLDTGIVPDSWTKAIIKPIPKSSENDPRIPLNYRGISLLSCVAKVFTSIMNTRITSYLDANEKICEEQNGFRAKRGCIDHIYSLHSIAKQRQQKGLNTFVTYIDFSKAFDCIDRNMLLYNLLQSGIEGKIYYVIKSLYNLTQACVTLNNTLSEWFITELGVRQGDNLSPTLFSIFINGLSECIKKLDLGVVVDDIKVSCLFYADDIIIMAENPINLQTMLNCINDWCITWKMKINMSKTKIMQFRKKGTERSIAKFVLGDKLITKCATYKYLGVVFDEFLEFNKNAEVLAGSGQRALGALIGKYKMYPEMGFETYTKCFLSNVCPILDYGSEVLGYCKGEKTEAVQYKAIRVFLGVNKSTSLDFLMGDMGWLPSKIRHKLSMLRLWNRLLKLDQSRLPKKIFEAEYKNGGYWCKTISNILTELNMNHLYENKLLCDLGVCEKKLFDLCKAEWSKRILKKPKLRSYCCWKKDYNTEPYVKIGLPREHRSILAQIRSGTLPLKIETGRFMGIKLDDRLCTVCDEGIVEDEKHFLLECNRYNDERSVFLNKLGILEVDNPNNLLKKLFSDSCRQLARYSALIYNVRKETEYLIVN